MAVVAVHEAVVDLVADHEEVVARGDVGQGEQGRLVQDGARRVAGVAQEQHLRARRDGRLDHRRIQGEVAVGVRRDVDRAAAVEDDRRGVGHVGRLVQHHLIARVDQRGHGHRDRLRGPDRDEQLALGVVVHPVQPRQVLGQCPAQLQRAVVARVVGPPGPQRAHAGLDDLRRRGEVGLANAQADDIGHRGDDVEELADARGRHCGHASGQARGGPDGGLDGHVRPSIRAGPLLIVPGQGPPGAPRLAAWRGHPGRAGRPVPGRARARRR